MNVERKIKAICFVLIFLISILSNLVASADVKNDERIDTVGDSKNIIEIRVAIYTDEEENEEFYGPYGYSKHFMLSLKNYFWQVENTIYYFNPNLISTKGIIRGELSKNNYDVLIYTPDQADLYLFYTAFSKLPKNIMRVRSIRKFIEDGGGYIGACGSSLIAGDMKNTPKTVAEYILKKSCLKISCVKYELKAAIPLLAQFVGRDVESIGPPMAYLLYSGWNVTNPKISFRSGIPLNVTISKDNPIFQDLNENKRKIRWIGAPGFEIPENLDREIMVLARFPEEEVSENDTINIHHWKYTGGIRGMMKALLSGKGKVHWGENLGIGMKAYVFAEDWVQTDKVVETNVSNKPFMTAEIYPNENQARIVLCSGHPELNVWWGGHIREADDIPNNNLFEAFHYWEGVTPEDETPEDEFSYNYWIIRRSAAWASKKVPDDSMPPIGV